MAKTGPTIQVVTRINSTAFYDIFFKTLNRPAHLKSSDTHRE